MKDLRTEYPRPTAMREEWLCLNGDWEFMRDDARNGVDKRYFEREHFDRSITVPYCPESVLSGIGETDFIMGVWYRRDVVIPDAWRGKRVMLHFGAVDNEAHVYWNGKEIGFHKGGYTPFSIEVTDVITDGVNSLCVYAEDDARDVTIPSGKQSDRMESYGCFYTRTTGIWQTVWLEPVADGYIKNFFVNPTIDAPSVTLRVRTVNAYGQLLTVKTAFGGKPTGEATVKISSEETFVTVALTEKQLWELGDGKLYDMTLSLSGGDTLSSYFGLREVSLDKRGMRLNGRYVFQRTVLDQGYYPDGIYTAPSDARLEADITDAMALGFNGARMHEKIFEPRYLYHADRHGFLVWGEFPNWGIDIHHYEAIHNILPPWIEEMERDYNHPSLIGWCPFNETWDTKAGAQCNDVLAHIYAVTKAFDTTRPCIDASGNFHVITDIFDVHNYEQSVDVFTEDFAHVDEGTVLDTCAKNPAIRDRQKYDPRLPLFISEYGGIQWDVEKDIASWGYGESVKSEEEFVARYKGLTDSLIDNPYVMGFCYTQLYDVEQEKNGLMTYDRRMKFDPAIFYAINTRKAKIEE